MTGNDLKKYADHALKEGATSVKQIHPSSVVTAAWVRLKCQFGCGGYGYGHCWPPGNAMAIFFGKTPMSTGTDPVPASAVNLIGRIIGDATVLKQAKGATKIRIERTDLKKS
jgi:hypothetical protein